MTYLEPLADRIRQSVPPGVGIPDDADDLFLLYALLGTVKGENVTGRDVHDAWVVWMQIRNQTHDSMVPFDELEREVQVEDNPYVSAIRQAVSGIERI